MKQREENEMVVILGGGMVRNDKIIHGRLIYFLKKKIVGSSNLRGKCR